MKIESSLTMSEIEEIVQSLHGLVPSPSVNDLFRALVDAGAKRAVEDLMELDDFEDEY